MQQDSEVEITAAEDAAFASGFGDKPASKAEAPIQPEPAAPERATAPAVPTPEYVQISAKDWEAVRTAAARTAGYDQQFAKVFGTLGNLQKHAPSGRKVEIPADAFADMARDFPELAEQTRTALERALAGGMPTSQGAVAADIDPAKFEAMLATAYAKREIEALEDAYPAWREIVGAVDITQAQPDPANPFRRWLATKDAAYQTRINATESAAVISRAIQTFQTESRARPAAPETTPRNDARADRIRGAIQPRGDRAGVPAGPSDDEQFEVGYNSR